MAALGASSAETTRQNQFPKRLRPKLRFGLLAVVALVVAVVTSVSLALAANTIEVPDSAGDVGAYASLAIDASGNPVVAYYDSTNGDLKILHCDDPACAPGGDSITSPDTVGDVGKFASLVLDSAGNPVVAYHDVTNVDLKILHCDDPNCAPGGDSITSPDVPGNVGADASLTLDAAGNPVVAYSDTTAKDLKLLRCDDPNCSGFGESIAVPDSSGFVGTHSSITVDSSGFAVVAYHDAINGNLKVLHCDDLNCVGTESVTTPDTNGFVGTHTSIVLDPAGNPIISYHNEIDGDLKVLHCDDPNCAGIELPLTVDSAGDVGRDTSIAVNSNGNPVVSYYGVTNGNLRLLICDDVDCAGVETPIVPDSVGNVGQHTSLAFDLNNKPVVAYYDAGLGDLRILRCLDCETPPDATDDAYTVAEDGTLNVLASIGVLANDTDPDPSPVTATIGVGPTNGSLVFNSNGSFVYTPVADFSGVDTFSYIASDPVHTATADVTITVSAVNDPPIATPDSASTRPSLPVTINVIDGSGGGPDTDADGDALTVATVGGSTNGTTTFAGQTVTYTPASGFTGTVTFSYAITDGLGSFTSSQVTVIVEPAGLCNGKVATIDMVLGDAGIGTAGDDVILGSSGSDIIKGFGGEDTICGGNGDDNIDGGDGRDFIFGGAGDDVIIGRDGNDRIRGQQGADTISGDNGNDFLFGGTGNDVITGNDGNDFIGGFGGDDLILAGAGNDKVFGGFGRDDISGGPGDDDLKGLIGDDMLKGEDGDDTISGDNGRDVLFGGSGNDVLSGGNSLDTLSGGTGNDTLRGGKADDVLIGDAGTDSCTGNLGTDIADVTCETIFGIP